MYRRVDAPLYFWHFSTVHEALSFRSTYCAYAVKFLLVDEV